MAIEPLVVRQLCADDPNSIPRQPQALVMDGPVYKREQLSCCHPPIVTSINHISLSMFNFMGSLCFLKCVKLPWADFLAHPVLSRGNHSGHAALTTLVQFLPQAGKGVGLARSLLFSCLPVLPLPDELGVTCIPSACPPSLKTRDLHFQQTSLSPGGQEGRPSPPTLPEACRCIS